MGENMEDVDEECKEAVYNAVNSIQGLHCFSEDLQEKGFFKKVGRTGLKTG